MKKLSQVVQLSALLPLRQGSCFQYYSVSMASIGIAGEMAENPRLQCVDLLGQGRVA